MAQDSRLASFFFVVRVDVDGTLSPRHDVLNVSLPSCKRALTWAETWAFLATQEEADEEDEDQIVDLEAEIREVIKDSSGECVPEHIVEQTVELAVSSGEAGSFGRGVNDTTSAAATAVGKSVGEARPPEIAKHSASGSSASWDKVQCCDSRNSSRNVS